MNNDNKNSGGRNSFYDIPDWVKNADDLNEYLHSTGPLSNIVKSLFSNLGDRHSGTSKRRDAKKILHYAVRHLLWIDRDGKKNTGIDETVIVSELASELDKNQRKKLLANIKDSL